MKNLKQMKNNIINHPLYETLLSEFHLIKNGDLKLTDLSYGSGKKVWWKCNKANDHEWKSSINKRTTGRNCPFCRGLKVSLSNCLATTHPNLINEWDYSKNVSITPFDVTSGSHKEIWWKCNKANDHNWKSSINSRTNINHNNGCPCCYGYKVVLSNCLLTTHPHIAEQWHKTKNEKLTPKDVVSGSYKKAWWECGKCNHAWCCIIKDKVNGSDCPKCNESRGEKALSYFLEKNSICYEREKKFDNCKYKNLLKFDFYLPKENILIEYDGIQHYKETKQFGGEKAFQELKTRDAIKTKFAQDNNIPLLRIPYTEFNNIENIISSFILERTDDINK